VLFGDFNPSGKLTHSWPKNMAQVPINFGDYNYSPLFGYKHGLLNFPSASSNEALLPYAAKTNGDGDRLILALSDEITSLNYESSDFEIKVDNIAIPDMISEVAMADFDESILYLELNSQIAEGEDISLSYSGSGISSSNLVLEVFNDLYVHNSVGNSIGGENNIPGKIEAENFFDMFGIQTEPCFDTGGGLNIGYIEAGDWMKYNVEVDHSGVYSVTGRISGYEPGSLDITFNDSIQISVNYSSTNGWQNWQDFTTEVSLEEGSYIMEVTARQNAFNINYYNFELISGISDLGPSIREISVYPNPLRSELHLDFTNQVSGEVRIKMIDITGKLTQDLYNGKSNIGFNSFRFTIDPAMPKGLYFLEIKDEKKRYFRKVILE
jgi:hypothetical protein